ncbi:MAG: hypothetical protein V1895_00235 [Parcubacteria group bacterium]
MRPSVKLLCLVAVLQLGGLTHLARAQAQTIWPLNAPLELKAKTWRTAVDLSWPMVPGAVARIYQSFVPEPGRGGRLVVTTKENHLRYRTFGVPGVYFFQVAIWQGSQQSWAWTNQVVAVPTMLLQLPDIQDLKVDKSGQAALLTWSAIDGADYYEIRRGDLADVELGKTVRLGFAVQCQYLDDGVLPDGRQYFYRVIPYEIPTGF